MTKPRLTQAEHTELGSVLAGIRDELQHRSTQLAHAYPRTGQDSVPYRKLQAAVAAIDEARTALDSAVINEHPLSGQPEDYYPEERDRAKVQIPRAMRRRI